MPFKLIYPELTLSTKHAKNNLQFTMNIITKQLSEVYPQRPKISHQPGLYPPQQLNRQRHQQQAQQPLFHWLINGQVYQVSFIKKQYA